MGNTHDTEVSRIEADYIRTKWKTNDDYRWGYTKERGPETWWLFYSSASGGNQSPVDIITEEVRPDIDTTRPPLKISYVTVRSEVKELANTGTTARLYLRQGASYITEGPCRGYRYSLDHIDLHWGETDSCGSEHYVNSRPYSAELQMVHWNEDVCDSYEEAAQRDDGLVVLSVFVKISEKSSCGALQKISEHIDDIMYRDQSVIISNNDIDIHSLLPDDVTKYWTYRGSMTTPPCCETVTWVILNEPINITRKCLSKFRQLHTYTESEVRPDDEHDGHLVKNSRPLQPRGTRKVALVDDELANHGSLGTSSYYSLQPGHDVINPIHDVSDGPDYSDEDYDYHKNSADTQRRDELYQWQH